MTLNKPIAIVLIILAIFLVYGNSLSNSFVHDDTVFIENSPIIRTWNNVPFFFTPKYFLLSNELTYRPVATFSFLIDHTFWKLNPFGYHLTNVLIHILNSLLLFLLLLKIFKKVPVSLLCTILFAVHPVTTEAVNGISLREDLLIVSFFLLSLLSYINFSYSPSNKIRQLIACIGYFLLALFSKGSAVVFILLFLLYEISFSSNALKVIKEKKHIYTGLFSALLFTAWIKLVLLRNPHIIGFPHPPFYERIITFPRIFVFYIKLFIFPVNLSAGYSCVFSRSLLEANVIFPVLFLILFASSGIFLMKRHKDLLFAIFWILVACLPVSNIVPLATPIAERYLYMPLIGFCIILALLFQSLYTRIRGISKYAVHIFLIFIIVFYSMNTINRNRDWKDIFSFYKARSETAPDNAKSFNGLGIIYHKTGQYDKAVAQFKKAIAMIPQYARAHNNLGLVYADMGKQEEAITSFKTAIKFNPIFVDAYNNIGRSLYLSERTEESIDAFKTALELNPHDAELYYNLAVINFDKGDKVKAIELLKKAIELYPDFTLAHFKLATIYGMSGEEIPAIRHYRKVLKSEPDNAPTHANLALTYYNQGKYGLAIKHCDRAIELGGEVHPGFIDSLKPYRNNERYGNDLS